MLIVMRGPSCAGKSRLALNIKLHFGGEIVSSDDIRKKVAGDMKDQTMNKEVFEIFHAVIEARMKAGLLTIADATHLKMADLSKVVEIAEKYSRPYCIVSMRPPALEELKERNRSRSRKGGLEVPESVLEKHLERYFSTFKEVHKKYRGKIIESHSEVSTYNVMREVDEILLIEPGFYRELDDDEELWTIGDVHSCYRELEELILLIQKRSGEKGKTAVIYQLGDFIDRGPSLEKTYDVLRKYGVHVIKGNHESAFLRELEGKKCTSKARRLSHLEFSFIKEKKQEEIANFMRSLPFYCRITDGVNEVLLTHGGVNDISGEFPRYLPLTEAACVRGSRTDTVLDGIVNPKHNLFIRQIHGHKAWEYKDISTTYNHYIVNVDGSCVYGGNLVAFAPQTNDYIVWQAHEDYSKKVDEIFS